jgi:hypothetical protein
VTGTAIKSTGHIRGLVLLAIAVVAGFLLGSAMAEAYEEQWSPARKWNDLSVTWYINDDVDDLVTGGKQEASVAANRWSDQNVPGSALDFNEHTSYSTADVKVHKGNACGFCGPAETLLTPASSGDFTAAEIILDTSFTWHTDGTMDGASNDADIRTVSLHEFGHTMGWDHRIETAMSDTCDDNTDTGHGKIQENSVMCTNHPWEGKSGLNNEDKVGQDGKY